uniref:SMODS and SLOG-associating 2TM effector domain-containing protein n=1 Tax=viral metagenome TaxID=1070528 RepID=A0A6C0DMD5_9ZZZZ
MGDAPGSDDSSVIIKQDWNPGVEKMLASWCDEAKCFEWMHTEAYSFFDKRARALTIASNVLTAFSGISNIMAGGININGFQLSWVFGTLSVVISITNMLQEKLGYLTKSIDHNHYATQWGGIRRKIEEQLSIPPESRKDCATFLKYLRVDINQVSVDGNSMIPERIRDECHEKFGKIQDFDLPDICGKVEHTKVYVKPTL